MKNSMKRVIYGCVVLLVAGLFSQARAEEAAKVSSERVAELQEQRFGMFICWSLSSFSGYEWTPGVEDISFFHPTGFDPDQWVLTAKEAGMNYILLLTKHHDGFCLWDTKTTDRKVTKAPLQVDVLREVKKACDKYGVKLALYFSEGDWSWSGRKDIHQSEKRPDIKKAQLKELLTEYGPIEFIWFDRAIGDGGLSHADTSAFVKSLQPDCFIGYNAGDQSGANLRIGERGGPAPLTEISPETIGSKARAENMKGHEGFRVAEFTYPLLEGNKPKGQRGAQWFYSLPENDNLAVSAEKIYSDYLGAKKYDNLFSLDVGPDRSGRLRKIDVAMLRKVGRYVRGEIELPPENVSMDKSAKASSVWQDDPGYEAKNAFDGDPATRWGAAEESDSGWIEVDLGAVTELSRAVVIEGDWARVEQFQIETREKESDSWQVVAKGKKIVEQFELRFTTTKARYARLNIVKANGVPTIAEFQLFGK